MASVAFSSGVFHPDQTISRPPKDFQPLVPILDRRHDLLKSGNLQLSTLQTREPWQPMSLSSDLNLLAVPGSISGKSLIVDVQDGGLDSVLFSFGIAEQFARYEKILQFLMSGSSIVEGGGLNNSLLSDLMGLRTLAIGMHPQQNVILDDDFPRYEIGVNESHNFLQPQGHHYCPEPFMNLDGNLSHVPLSKQHDNNQVFIMSDVAKMKDLLSIVSEYYLPKNSKSSKLPMVVPYFRWTSKGKRAKCQGSSSKLQNDVIAPGESFGTSGPNSSKVKPLAKKKQNRKAGSEKDLKENSYLYAYECLMTFITSKNGDTHSLVSLKKSGHGVTQFLNDFSAGIAGTGIAAVLLSVVSRVASGRAVFCAAKLYNTGFGLGLVWLSLAVNGLRDTVIEICKNSSKVNVKDEEITERVDQSVKEIIFRFVALMAVLILKFG